MPRARPAAARAGARARADRARRPRRPGVVPQRDARRRHRRAPRRRDPRPARRLDRGAQRRRDLALVRPRSGPACSASSSSPRMARRCTPRRASSAPRRWPSAPWRPTWRRPLRAVDRLRAGRPLPHAVERLALLPVVPVQAPAGALPADLGRRRRRLRGRRRAAPERPPRFELAGPETLTYDEIVERRCAPRAPPPALHVPLPVRARGAPRSRALARSPPSPPGTRRSSWRSR